MATHYNVRTVTDGLVLALDAANPKSYSGLGNTWSDLSGNGNAGALVNSPTYNPANGGYFSFNGSNQYINAPLTKSATCTFSCWASSTNVSNNPMMFNAGPSGAGPALYFTGGYIEWNIWDSGNRFSTIPTNANDGKFHHYAVVNDATSGAKLYYDGTLLGTATYRNASGNTNLTIGGNTSSFMWNGNISNFTVQNRALSAAEVLQNYNALKSRYIAAPSIPTPTLPIIGLNYEQLTYIVSGNLTATGNGTTSVDIFKTSGSSSWDNQAYSTTAFSAPCTIEFNKQAGSTDNGVSYAMISWNEDPTTNASYATLDYASYPYGQSAYVIYHNSSAINPGTSWNSALKLYVVYGTDGFIRHYNGSTLLYSVNYGTGRTVYVDSSFFSVDSTFGGFSNIKVIRSAWNGSSYV